MPVGPRSANRVVKHRQHVSLPQLDQHVTGKKRNLLGFFVGQVMKLSKGSADARVVKETMMDMLEKRTQEEAGGGN